MANAFLPHHSKVLTQLGMNKCYHYIHHLDVGSWRFAQQPRHSCSSLATYWPRDCRQVGLSLRSLRGSLLSCWMGVMWHCQPHSVLGTIKWDSANKIPIFCTISGSWWMHLNHKGFSLFSASFSFSCFFLSFLFHLRHHEQQQHRPHHHLYVICSLTKPRCLVRIAGVFGSV